MVANEKNNKNNSEENSGKESVDNNTPPSQAPQT